MDRISLIIALFQVTGRGKVFSMNDIKEMNNKQLEEQWEYYSDLKTSNSRRNQLKGEHHE